MDNLMQKLMMSKAIMDKHNTIQRGGSNQSLNNSVESFNMPPAKYNIPQEFLQESNNPMSSPITPRENTKPVGVTSVEAIKNSKLPDEIKRLMIEHPIAQPQQPQMTISDELVEKASRLMKKESNNYIPESAKPTKVQSNNTQPTDTSGLKKMIKETLEEILKENGVISESTEKTNEQFTFRVGKHIFEGKVTKVKKIS